MDPQQISSLLAMLKNPNNSMIPPQTNVSMGTPSTGPNSVMNGTPTVDPSTGMLSGGTPNGGMLGASPYAGGMLS